jgi:hypothetical protein
VGWQSHKKLEPYRASKSESGAGNRTDSGSSIKRENRTTTLKNSAEVRLMEAQGLLDFVEIEQQPGEVVQLFAGMQSDLTDNAV